MLTTPGGFRRSHGDTQRAERRDAVASLAAGVLLAGAITVGFGALGAAAATSPKSVAEIARYRGADRQAMLEAGARRESHLMIYTTGTQSIPVFQAFEKKYPFIKVDALREDVAEAARRMIEEYGAQTHNVDVVELTTAGLHPLLDAGLLQSYYSPELASIEAPAIGPGEHWALDYQSFLGLGFNTRLVPPDEAPKSLDDLLDPKWKGKMAMPGTSTLANWVGAILRQKDEAFLREFAAQKVRIYEMSGRAVANFVVSGEVPLSPAIYSSHIANSQSHGAPVAWRALGGVYSITDGAALATDAPHPHAAMLYMDFVLSREGQALFQKLGYASARRRRSPDAGEPEIDPIGRPRGRMLLAQRRQPVAAVALKRR